MDNFSYVYPRFGVKTLLIVISFIMNRKMAKNYKVTAIMKQIFAAGDFYVNAKQLFYF